MNKITLIGNLTRDPEISTTASGISMCRFTIAVDRRRGQSGGNGEKQTDFFRIVTWRQQADNCARFLSKGKKVAVVGELQASAYQDKNGEARASLDVVAEEVEFLSPRQDGQDPSSSERYSPAPVQNSNQTGGNSNPSGFVDVDDDDQLPF